VRRALISDIHGNLEALQAVFGDIAARKVDEVVCLGDIIGYGPNPCECLDLVIRRCKTTVKGNHDQAALIDPEGFNPVALQAIYWTRDQLDTRPGPMTQRNRRWDFLGELPQSHRDGPFLFVHGSPIDHTNEYVFPESIYDQRKMDRYFNKVEQFCFQGHTHLPGVFTQSYDFHTPKECNYVYTYGDQKLMVNVGSVGQPRDEDPRACYVIVDDARKQIEFNRVEYDVEITVKKIYAVEDLANMLGDRLRTGR
jgi:predicted phosphodiesterase